ncbi:hypothetical protein FA13DRAFT_1739675 [Coprinellus micaceus]|uniref:Uncharacterized protein n=1 Tax=Coprinellus micaceus TaxID=71717 RepID=A0A4Y7SPT6_COPMI|nr:hypothetical protein FA13DRAFT_1739675 [Coprinellus micaceus]
MPPDPQPSSPAPNVRAYFARYPGFTYDPSKGATSEFRRLRRLLSRQGKDAGTEAPLREFTDALGNQFGEKYGTKWDDLPAWQSLCRRIGINPVPEELEMARKAVHRTYVNIIDLIDDVLDGEVPTFPTKKDLRVYTTKQKKLFTGGWHNSNTILTSLLTGNRPAMEQSGSVEDTLVHPLSTTFAPLNITSDAQPAAPSTSSLRGPFVEPDSDDEGETVLPLRAFFTQFSGFIYQSSNSATSEFRRLCRTRGWKREDSDRADAYINWSDAMANQFGAKFGVDMGDLGAWQRLCARIEINPIPDVLEEARELVFNSHVNLVDLVGEGRVTKFPTERALSVYSKKKRKIFPSDSLAAGDILTALLRYIYFPPPESSRRTSLGVLIRA